jgi:hypothetical protein
MTQYLSTIVPQAQAVAAINGTNQQIATLSLPGGKWMVNGELWCTVTSGVPTVNTIAAGLSVGSLITGRPTDPAAVLAINMSEPMQTKQTGGSTVGWVLPLTALHIDQTTTAIVYLNGELTWASTGTLLLYGKITAQGEPAADVQAYPNFLLVHSSIDTRVGYINLNDIRWIKAEGTGSEIQVDDQIWHLTETATYIASGGTQP